MNEIWMKGKWNEYKGKAKERWGKLTDSDLTRIEGKRDQLVGIVQQQYGRTKEQAEKEISDWERELGRAEGRTASSRERIADAVNPTDIGERGTTGPASI